MDISAFGLVLFSLVLVSPKYSFHLWVVMQQRRPTADQMQKWNVDADPLCILCKSSAETHSHLFFFLNFLTHQVYGRELIKGILGDKFSSAWSDIVTLNTDTSLTKTELFPPCRQQERTLSMMLYKLGLAQGFSCRFLYLFIL